MMILRGIHVFCENSSRHPPFAPVAGNSSNLCNILHVSGPAKVLWATEWWFSLNSTILGHFHGIHQKSMIPMRNHLNGCFAWTKRKALLYKAYFSGISTIWLPFSPNPTHLLIFSWKLPKIGDFRGLGRKVPTLGARGWKYYQFGTVIACPNAMAAPGTTFHPKTPKSQCFS